MIVPRDRLVFWTAFLGLALAVGYAIEPGMIGVVALACAALAAIAAADAAFSLGRLDGVEASFPPVTRLTKDREGPLELEIKNEKQKSINIRLGLLPPRDLAMNGRELDVVLPEGAALSRIQIPVTPLRRGVFHLENVYLETASALGLWSTRKTSAARGEVRAYPNTLHEQKNLAALFLNRGMFGVHAQRQVGKGREFEKLREYVPGDGYEDVHWKATAKRGFPVTKVFQIERTQEIYVVIDSSRLSARTVESVGNGSGETTQLERFITAAMVLGLVAEKQGDLFGVVAFSDKVNRFVRARNGKAHYGAVRDALYALEPDPVNPDFGEVFSFIKTRMRRRALLIFLTNLDDPVLAENFVDKLPVLSGSHLVLVNMLTAPGVAPLFSSPDVANIDGVYEKLGGHLVWQRLKELEGALNRRGAPMSMIANEGLCPELVSQYIGVKRRQLL